MMWDPRHASRLGEKLSDLVAEVAKVDLAGKTRIDLVVGCDDEDEEAVGTIFPIYALLDAVPVIASRADPLQTMNPANDCADSIPASLLATSP